MVTTENPPVAMAKSNWIPRGLERRVEQTREDLRMLWRDVTGVPHAPFRGRDGARFVAWPSRRAGAGLRSREVEVVAAHRETADAITLELRALEGHFEPTPGQFFTFVFERDGQELRRAYSVSSACAKADRFAVTVKRVAGGFASNRLNDAVEVGDRLRVFGPAGSFTVTPDPDARRDMVLVAGGSGITPMMALMRTLLPAEPHTRMTLVYGNRGMEDVIFREALDELVAAHPGRLAVRHVLERPPGDWDGGVGQLGPEVARAQLEGEVARASSTYWICGPEPMMDAVRTVLVDLGVGAARMHEESFSAPHRRTDTTPEELGSQPVVLRVGEERRELVTEPGETLLEAGLRAGLDMPYSCAMGGCAACKVRVRGDVVMEEPNCLSEAERTEGQVLACIARATGRCEVEVG